MSISQPFEHAARHDVINASLDGLDDGTSSPSADELDNPAEHLALHEQVNDRLDALDGGPSTPAAVALGTRIGHHLLHVEVTDRLDALASPLADAVGVWMASSVDESWVPTDGWANEGTAGTDLDLVAANAAAALGVADESGTTVENGNRVTPALVSAPAGFEIGFGLGDADNGGNDYGFAGAAGLDMSGSFTFTIDYTPLGTGLTSMRYLRKGGPFLHPGLIFEEVPAIYGGYVLEALGPNVSVSPLGGFVVATGSPAAGRQQSTLVLDRDSHLATFFRSGAQVAGALTDETGMGDATTAFPLIVGPGQTVHNIVVHDRALSSDEAIALHALLAAT